MDVRVRMVLLGLVLGVVVAVIVAAQGCGGHHPRKQHADGGPPGGVPGLASVPPPSGGGASSVPHAASHRADPDGPFFSFRRGRIARADAPRTGRMVALTFDDGPGPLTGRIVARLHHLHARATFFVVGQMAEYRPAAVRAERRAGMQIGNHTWSHPVMPSLSTAAQRLEIQRTNQILRRLTGSRPRFFRPPDWRVGARTARIVRQERMIGVLRTVDTRDWTLPGAREIARRALQVRPGGIVAMHDAGGDTRQQTLDAVPSIVRGLRKRHLRLVTIAELYAGRAL